MICINIVRLPGLVDASNMTEETKTSSDIGAPKHTVIDVPPVSQNPTPAETPFEPAVEEQAAYNLPFLSDTISNVREVAASTLSSLAGAASSVLPASMATLVEAEQPKSLVDDAVDGDDERLPIDSSYPNAFDDTRQAVPTNTLSTVINEMDDSSKAPATVDNDTQDEETAESIEKTEPKDESSYEADQAPNQGPDVANIKSHCAPVLPLMEESGLKEEKVGAKASAKPTPTSGLQNTPVTIADHTTNVLPVPISPINQTVTLDGQDLPKADDLEDEHQKSKPEVDTGSQPLPLLEGEPASHTDGAYEKRVHSLPAVKAHEVQDEAFNKSANGEDDYTLAASQVKKSPLPTFTYEDVDSIPPTPLIHLDQSPPSAAISGAPSSMLDPLLTPAEATTDDELAGDDQDHVGGVVDEGKQAFVEASDTNVTKTPTEDPAHTDSPTRTLHATEMASSGDTHYSRSKHVEFEPTPVASCAPLTTQGAVESKPLHPTVAHE
jgi:hypothetical protein